jgi:hypothetical protein
MWIPIMKLRQEYRDVTWLNRMYYRWERPDTESISSTNEKEIPVAPMIRSGEIVSNAVEMDSDATVSGGDSRTSGPYDEISSDDSNGGGWWKPAVKTRSGRTVQSPTLYEDAGATALGLTVTEMNYYVGLQAQAEEEFEPPEIACFGAGISFETLLICMS